jgi:uncharacterized membrane protein YtjA (UPF0391 family)
MDQSDPERGPGARSAGVGIGQGGSHVLMWAIVSLVVAIVAGAFGFTGVVRGAVSFARVIFGLFLVIATLLFVLLLAGVDMSR